MPKSVVKVDPDRLVVGLANGWAHNNKFLFLRPEELQSGYDELVASGTKPRGFAFYNIQDEGLHVASFQGPFYMALELKKLVSRQHAWQESM